MTKKILTVVTNAATLTLTDGTAHPSGYWAEEFAVPYELYLRAGFEVDVATIGGIVPSVDKSSLDPNMMKWVRPQESRVDDAALSAQLKRTLESCGALRAPLDLSRVGKDELRGYAGVYIAGGHGCMEDMPSSPVMTRVLLQALALDLPIGSVCHGPTAFLAPRDAAGESPFAGYRMTCFSHVEEFQTPINGRLPLVLQRELQRLGIQYSKASAPWASHVVVDRNIVTGQNPYSSEALAKAFLELLAR
ncbi:MAG: type 1 glutamine amidotransferase domain-containing protein [Sandaracinaceae bacterium]|nr:type 1 glutamine amidotransferase domain-containing protein [Sandaracinaceae bacterium]